MGWGASSSSEALARVSYRTDQLAAAIVRLSPAPSPAPSARSSEVPLTANRSSGFVGTWLGVLRDRMSCGEQPLYLSFLPPFTPWGWFSSGLGSPLPSLSSPGEDLDQPFLGSRAACSGGA